MPIMDISRIEPVTAPNKMNDNEPRDNFGYSQKQSGHTRQNQSQYNKSQHQIVFMERSVQNYLGQNLNIYG